ncbi:MAG: helix-turn-helix transcriptional regulator [Myxococcales bacterium]|nr:helix-turn-helix transcriptional regulator [Myxococcales bacterium]MCB9649312.1 helix-turn-helix transcriptional regulator [Deltaproteobacteria bacterium]
MSLQGGLDCDAALRLAGHVFDCAMDPSHWPLTLQAFLGAFRCQGAALVQVSKHEPRTVLRETYAGAPPSPRQLAHYRALDPSDPRVIWAAGRFGVARASNLEPPNAAGPAAVEYVLVLPELVDDQMVVTLWLSRSTEPFNAADVYALQSMHPHLMRALRTQHRLGAAEGLGRDLRDALQRLPVGVIIVEPSGKVRFLSEAAERVVALADGLGVVDGALAARAVETNERLQALLQRALDAARAEYTQPEDTLVVPRPSGARPYEVLVTPLRADRLALWPEEPSAMVIIHDPAAVGTLPWELVQRLYGLSPAEAKLSVALAGGAAIKDYAESAAISVETARSQLKAAMAKTRTHRQAELIRRILTGPAAYTSSGPAAVSERPEARAEYRPTNGNVHPLAEWQSPPQGN